MVIVADGNGIITCSSLAKYPDYPVSLIPECYDQQTNSTVKRDKKSIARLKELSILQQCF